MSNWEKMEILSDSFFALLNEYSDLLKGEGVRCQAVSSSSNGQLFQSLSFEERSARLHRIQEDLDLFHELMAAKKSLKDSPQLLWRYLAKNKLTPCPDIFDKIGDTDIVCVYDSEQRQTFQNLNFFDWVSITLEQLFCMSWYHYSERDLAIEKKLYDLAVRFFTGEIKSTVAPDAGLHLVKEKDTELMSQFLLEVKYLSPVFSEGRIAGVIAINRCEPIPKKTEA